jgi:mycothiol synthase
MDTLSRLPAFADLPSLDGFRLRAFQGPEDFEHMAAILAAARVVDGVERAETAASLANDYAHLVNSDPQRDMLFAELDGQVVAYNRCWWEQEENGPRLYGHIGVSTPASRGRGLGRTALRWLEGRLRAIAAEHPTGTERFFQTFVVATETARIALLASAGYHPARYGYDMVRPLDQPVAVTPLPAGLEVRPAQPEHYRAIWEADAEAFRDHWGYVPPTETNYQGWLAGNYFQPYRWQIAWDTANNQVAGMVQNFVNEQENREYNRRRGYTEGISVRRPYRRLGLARALLTRSLRIFQDQGYTEAALGVDAQNPNGALRLYESVGFRVERQAFVYRKPLE